MRIIIAGSRDAKEEHVLRALRLCSWSGFASAVISGAARGADSAGELWAEKNNLDVVRVPAQWEKLGRRAGPIRNEEMAKRAEGLVAVWDGVSPGTKSMLGLGHKYGLRVFVLRTDNKTIMSSSGSGLIAAMWSHAEERAAIMEHEGGMTREDAERAAGASAMLHFRRVDDLPHDGVGPR